MKFVFSRVLNVLENNAVYKGLLVQFYLGFLQLKDIVCLLLTPEGQDQATGSNVWRDSAYVITGTND